MVEIAVIGRKLVVRAVQVGVVVEVDGLSVAVMVNNGAFADLKYAQKFILCTVLAYWHTFSC